MDVGILTHYNVASHGAYLQLYAMQQVLKALGCTPYVLTYTKNFDFADEEAVKFNVSLRNAPYFVRKYLRQTGVSNCLFQLKKQRELRSFGARTFAYRPYSRPGLDAAIIGADEVFSLQYGANVMMYGHGIGAQRIVAYAPSFGQTNIERIDHYRMRSLIASGLKSFDALSVRDEVSRMIVAELTGLDVPIVCDPALLYDFAPERTVFTAAEPPVPNPYVLIYAYTSNMNEPKTVDSIRNFVQRHGLATVSIEGYHGWCDMNVSTDPIRMLSYFRNARAVITDTFHGTISSIITQTPFALFTRSTNTVKIGHLVRQLGLQDRVISTANELEDVLACQEDFASIDECVVALRQEGLCYVERALGLGHGHA